MPPQPMRITIWGENVHDRTDERVRQIYPNGMHQTIADGLQQQLSDTATIRTATLDGPDQGLPDDLLQQTDVLSWWGHVAHDRVEDALVERIHRRVLAGMGLLVLHSAHYSKIFRRLLGTTCSLRWRESDDREIVYTVNSKRARSDEVG